VFEILYISIILVSRISCLCADPFKHYGPLDSNWSNDLYASWLLHHRISKVGYDGWFFQSISNITYYKWISR